MKKRELSPRERGKLITDVLAQLGDESIKAYLDKGHADHDRIVQEVSDTLHSFFGETPEQEAPEPSSAAEPTRSTQSIIDEVYYDKNSRLHAAYFQSGHPDHHRMVEWFSGIIGQHLGAEGKKEFQPALFPAVTRIGKPGEETAEAGDTGERLEPPDLDNYIETFGGDDNE